MGAGRPSGEEACRATRGSVDGDPTAASAARSRASACRLRSRRSRMASNDASSIRVWRDSWAWARSGVPGAGAGAGDAGLCPRAGTVPAGAAADGICRGLPGCEGGACAASCAAACSAACAAPSSMTAGSAAGAAAGLGPARAAAPTAPGPAPSTRRMRRFSWRSAASLPASREATLSRYALSELYSGRPASIMPRMCSSRDGSHIPDSAISRTSSALYWGATRGARGGSIYCYRAAPGGAQAAPQRPYLRR